MGRRDSFEGHGWVVDYAKETLHGIGESEAKQRLLLQVTFADTATPQCASTCAHAHPLNTSYDLKLYSVRNPTPKALAKALARAQGPNQVNSQSLGVVGVLWSRQSSRRRWLLVPLRTNERTNAERTNE